MQTRPDHAPRAYAARAILNKPVLIFIAIFLGALGVDYSISHWRLKTFSTHQDLWSSDPAISAQTGPKLLRTPATFVRQFSIALDFLATDDNYDNLFQTADEGGVRVELQHPNTLYVALGDSQLVRLTDRLSLGEWHHLDITSESPSGIALTLDGQTRVIAGLDASKMAFDTTVIGTGFKQQRNFQGTIRNFTLSSRYFSNPPLWRALKWLVQGLFSTSLIILLGKYRPSKDRVEARGASLSMQPGVIYAAIFLVYLVAYYVSVGLGFNPTRTYLILSLGPFVFVPLAALRGSFGLKGMGIRRFGVFIPTFSVIALILLSQTGSSKARLSPETYEFLAFATLALCLSIRAVLGRSETSGNGAGGLLRLVFLYQCVFVCLFALLTLPTTALLVSQFAVDPFRTLFVLSCLSYLIVHTLDALQAGPPPISTRPSRLGFGIWAVIFFVMSFRADRLSEGASAVHWEYFVGPIRTLRAGGWLLSDTPSQYGFLNILIPALLPVSSPWNAFYVFQGGLLFVTALLILWTLTRKLRVGHVLAGLIIFFCFFLSDPELIGPALYPSSSAVRFFWCYGLLAWNAAVFFGGAPSIRRYARWGALFWILGVLWSAESALYATAIYFAPLALFGVVQASLAVRQSRPFGQVGRDLSRLLVPAAVALIAAVIGISLAFAIGLGSPPDLRMYVQYIAAYGGGFGALPITLTGPIWIFALGSFVGAVSLAQALKARQSAEGPAGAAIAGMACLWIVSSYYVGRAVPNNVIALYPILCFCLVIALAASRRAALVNLTATAVLAPLLTLSLSATVMNGAAVPTLAGLNLLPTSRAAKLPASDEELQGLLTRNGVTTGTPIIFYGYDTFMPAAPCGDTHCPYEMSWLPTPFQLLEDPISDETRTRIIERFAGRHPDGGTLVKKRNEWDDRFAGWLDLLKRFYGVREVAKTPAYTLYVFAKKGASP